MRKIFLPLLLLTGFVSFSQSVGRLRYDTTIIEKVGGSNELIIRNKTRDTLGYLFNAGGGRVIFKTIPASGGGSVTLTDSLQIDSLIKRYSITTFGDSFTAGFTELVGGYPERLSNLSGRYVINNGIGGATSQVILADFLAKPSQWLYSTVFWSGYNNRDEATTIIANCKRMADSLIAHGNNRFLFLTIPNGPADSAVGATHYMWYDSIIKVQTQLEAQYPGHVADARAFLVSKYNPALPNDVLAHSQDQIPPSLRTEAYPNGVHLTTAGYFYVARLIDSAYGAILYDRDLDTQPMSTNNTLNITQGLLPQMNVGAEGAYLIGGFQMLGRPNRYNAPGNYVASNSRSITTGTKNVLLGVDAGIAVTTGSENTLLGYKAGQLLAATNNNVGIGSSAMTNTSGAFDNVMIGYQTGLGTGAFGRNTAVGSTALRSMDTGTDNIGIGQGAGSGLQSGVNNVIIGRAAGSNGLTENRMTIIGANACTQCTVGENSSIGYQSLFNTTSGANNTALGQYSQYSNVLGNHNTSVGQYSQWGTNGFTTSQYQNTSVGAYSLYQIRAGADRNIAIGYKACTDSITGDNNTIIGDSIEFAARTNSNQLNIKNTIYGQGMDGQGQTVSTAPIIGIGTKTPSASAILDLTSTTKGFLVPRQTQAQRDAISAPAAGLLIYDTDNSAFEYYNGAAWLPVSSGGGGGTDNTNAGSFNRWVIPSSQAIKTAAPGLYQLIDSTSNTNALTFKIDSAVMFPAIRATILTGGSPGGSDTHVQFNRNGSFSANDSLTWTSNGLNNKYRYRINGVQVAWLPDQTSFPSVMYLGNGTGSALAAGATFNTAVGLGGTLGANTTGASNTGVGSRAFQANTTGSNNTGDGEAVGFSNTTGSNNSYLGKSAGQSNSTSSNITGIGYNALINSTGANNTGVGASVMNSNIAGADNTGVGFQAIYQNGSGTNNTGIGSGVLTGTGGNNFSSNTGLGYFVMHSVTTGSSNTGAGANSLLNITTGGSNTALGVSSGGGITTGGNNLILGDGLGSFAAGQAGTVVIGSNSLRRIWINSTGQTILGGAITSSSDTVNRAATVTANGTFKIETAAAATSVDSITTIENGLVGKIDATNWGRTASTGLTNVAGTWTDNLSTGVSGGQTLKGGTGANDQLLIRGSVVASGSTVTNPDVTFVVGDGAGTTAFQLLKDATAIFSGGIRMPYVEKTSTYSALVTDYTINCTSGTFTVTFALSSTYSSSGKNQIFNIKNSGVGVITLAGTSGETFDGTASPTIVAGGNMVIQAKNSGGFIVL